MTTLLVSVEPCTTTKMLLGSVPHLVMKTFLFMKSNKHNKSLNIAVPLALLGPSKALLFRAG